ncbi:hypothetical protein POM88_043215 [Heracleum sosnowskyi]|uniref:Uncharacterized protein n=1 Tax=Heracleum sosnowskyi TaxID=360622 RepID=A0AAD8M2X1_9APIA|nr:hypothetical protein POM88_043215 [Heracleum sosnowskyi]
MAAQPINSIYTQDSRNNGSVGIKKPGTMNYQWRPTTRNDVDERNLENTLVSTPQISYKASTMNSLPPLHSNTSKKISENGSLAATSKANMEYLSNSKATMQQDKVAPITLANGVNAINLPPIGVGAGTATDHIGKLSEKMQTTTISTKSKTTTDDGDKIWLPQMDGINVVLPSSSVTTNHTSAATSTTDHKVKMTDEMLKTEEYINYVLYGPRKAIRLPIFEQICPSSLFSDTEKPN